MEQIQGWLAMKAEAPRRHGLDERGVQVWKVGFSSGGHKKAGKGMLMAEGRFESRDNDSLLIAQLPCRSIYPYNSIHTAFLAFAISTAAGCF